MSMAGNWMFNYPCSSKHGDETKPKVSIWKKFWIDLGILRKGVLTIEKKFNLSLSCSSVIIKLKQIRHSWDKIVCVAYSRVLVQIGSDCCSYYVPHILEILITFSQYQHVMQVSRIKSLEMWQFILRKWKMSQSFNCVRKNVMVNFNSWVFTTFSQWKF